MFEKVKPPEGKLDYPVVIESKSNFIEQPELVAQCVLWFANRVGRYNTAGKAETFHVR